MSDYQFIKSYLEDFSDLLKPNNELIEKLIRVRNLLLEVRKNNNKVLIFGNGGSAAIASHFSVDLTKNARVRCLNFNEADLITCFANDYGFEHWVKKAVDFYGDAVASLIADQN
ncbi:MAG: SIS domain-containing protein, partial [Kordiimonadaceae bacterium]|nr:SIS domain-containing protein [Kordiimonadaceae bacterium]